MTDLSTSQVRHSTCPHDCPSVCALEVEVIDEDALRAEQEEKLQAFGHQVDIAHIHPGHAGRSTDTVAGLTVHRLPLKGHRLAGWAVGLGELAQGYDLLHVHDPQLMAITANVRMACPQVPAVLSTHGGFRHTQQMALFKSVFERVALRRMLSHYRMVLASSVADEAYFRGFSDRVRLCSNGVNTDKFGVVPQQIAGGDIYPALEKGTIDAAEWVGPYDDEKLGFYKIAPNYYYPGWWEACSMYSMYVNIKEWEKLPKAYQNALEVACYEANLDMMAEYDFKNPQALARLLKNGVKLYSYSTAIMKEAQKAAFDLYEEEASKNPSFKKIYEPWKKFRHEQFLWNKVAENTLSGFMLNNM